MRKIIDCIFHQCAKDILHQDNCLSLQNCCTTFNSTLFYPQQCVVLTFARSKDNHEQLKRNLAQRAAQSGSHIYAFLNGNIFA